MSARSRVNYAVFVVSVIFFCTITKLAAAQSPSRIRGPSSYSADQIHIQQAALIEDGKVKITFRGMPETLWYCPGANGKTTKDAIELTFVRAPLKNKPKVTYPATVDDDGFTRCIVVDAKGKPLFLKSGNTRMRVFSRKETIVADSARPQLASGKYELEIDLEVEGPMGNPLSLPAQISVKEKQFTVDTTAASGKSIWKERARTDRSDQRH